MTVPRRDVGHAWSELLSWGYAAWFVATFGVLGYLAGWQLDRAIGGPTGRIVVTTIGVAGGAIIASAALRAQKRRRGAGGR